MNSVTKVLEEAEKRLEAIKMEPLPQMLDYFSSTDAAIDGDCITLNPLPPRTLPIPKEQIRIYRARVEVSDACKLDVPSAITFLSRVRTAIVEDLKGCRIVEFKFRPSYSDTYFLQNERLLRNDEVEFRIEVRYLRGQCR